MLTPLIAVAVVCGVTSHAHAQSAAPKAGKDAAKPAAAKPAAKPDSAAAAAAGGAEPNLIGQFGTWGAYTAMPNGKKVCFALAKPSSSKTNPPNRPRDPAYAFVSTRPARSGSSRTTPRARPVETGIIDCIADRVRCRSA